MYSGGVYASSDCTTSINHGVLIVGYGTRRTFKGDLPYWIIKNRYQDLLRCISPGSPIANEGPVIFSYSGLLHSPHSHPVSDAPVTDIKSENYSQCK